MTITTDGRWRTVAIACLAAAALAGCTDPALVDRVAAMERSQDQLRASLVEMGAPDPAAVAAREALAAEVAAVGADVTALADELTVLATTVDELRAQLESGQLEDDERLTALELQLAELGTSLTTVRDGLDALTDETGSLEVQLDSHVDDPGAHAGAPTGP